MRRTLIALTLLLTAAPAWAGTELSLAEAMERALSGHTELQITALSRDQAQASLLRARSSWDPQLTAGLSSDSSENRGYIAGYPTSSQATGWGSSAGVSGTLPTGTSWSVSGRLLQDSTTTSASLGGVEGTPTTYESWSANAGVKVSQDLLALLRDSAPKIAVRTSSEQLSRAEAAVLQAEQGAVVEVASAWWDWAAAAQAEALAGGTLAEAEALERRTRAWLEEGRVAELELSRVTAEQLAARRDLLLAASRTRKAGDRLLVLLGREPGADLSPGAEALAWPVPSSLDAPEHLARAAAGNLDLRLAQLDLDAAHAAAGDARDQRLPSLDLSGTASVGSLSASASEAVSDLRGDAALPGYGVALDLTVPLSGRSARAARDSAEAAVLAAKLRLDARERTVRADTLAALDAVGTARLSLALAEARLRVAQETEAGERARVEEGLTRLDQLLLAQDQRDQAAATVISARRDLSSAELSLAAVEGAVVAPR
ncbi:MAG: TolC family protein [Deltaproteobacteria bacterium]|nr:TolC family protein [Deltaproteobacteria bacterium]